MRKIVECIPNFSEGRRREVVEALERALVGGGARLLDSEMDPAHNRAVISIAGEPEAVARGVVAAVGEAVARIDLREHEGEHPRIGAADVIPLVPIAGVGMEECIGLSVEIARTIAERYGVPVYLYEQSARVPERQDLARIRHGEFEGLREEIRTDPERRPDFGPAELHPSAGATVVGARFPLIAYNAYLDTADVKVAQSVARAVRHSSGGLRYVKALGFEIQARRQVQVSMNLTNFEGTPIFRALAMVRVEAARYGASVVSTEIVGLVPQRALDACAEHYLQLEGFSPRQVLENRLAESDEGGRLDRFLEEVAVPTAVPGGGSAAALAGALAASLGEMVSGLTARSAKFAAVEPRMRELGQRLAATRSRLQRLVDEDSRAYEAVLAARKLPSKSEEERETRRAAIETATRRATEVPLETARAAAEVLAMLEELAGSGNPNLRSDAAGGAQIAHAALKGGQYNVLVNLPGLQDAAFAESSRSEVARLAREGAERLARVDATFLVQS